MNSSFDVVTETPDAVEKLRRALEMAQAVVVGAGAGLSTSAGFTYSGERFERYFFDFAEEYGIGDIYSGGFFPFPEEEIRWAWWARHIYFNRYVDPPRPVYQNLHRIVSDKDYFVITTNVDHMFQKSGFDKTRLFYTQGDYGLSQTVDGRNGKTYDNEEWVSKAMEAQGFTRDEKGEFQVPGDRNIQMRIPAELIPRSPDDGSEMTMNLRADDTFVQDVGWYQASERYTRFLKDHCEDRTLFLELGVGANTPGIIKIPFLQMAAEWDKATYACLNYGEAFAPKEIEDKSICVNGDIGECLARLR